MEKSRNCISFTYRIYSVPIRKCGKPRTGEKNLPCTHENMDNANKLDFISVKYKIVARETLKKKVDFFQEIRFGLQAATIVQ